MAAVSFWSPPSPSQLASSSPAARTSTWYVNYPKQLYIVLQIQIHIDTQQIRYQYHFEDPHHSEKTNPYKNVEFAENIQVGRYIPVPFSDEITSTCYICNYSTLIYTQTFFLPVVPGIRICIQIYSRVRIHNRIPCRVCIKTIRLRNTV